MTAEHNPNDLPAVLDQLRQAEPDLLRSMLTAFVQALMSADADAACGAEFGSRSPDRTNRRNGYRHREWDTRAGTIELAIPKLREGSYFPDWLLERCKRAEKALISVVATSYLLGVSTRRMEKLVEQLGITRLSKSQVSVMAKDLDAQVEAFRTRPLDAGPYTFIAADALTMKVREAGRVVNVAGLVPTGQRLVRRSASIGLTILRHHGPSLAGGAFIGKAALRNAWHTRRSLTRSRRPSPPIWGSGPVDVTPNRPRQGTRQAAADT